MPSTAQTVSGSTNVPGAYLQKLDTSSAGRQDLSQGRLGLVANLPFLAKDTPVVVTTAEALKSLDPDDVELARLAKLIYEATRDDRITGTPSAVVLVNPSVVTQALRTLLDTGGGDSLVLTAKHYGARGNRVTVDVDNNVADATLRNFIIGRNGFSETLNALGSGVVMEVQYTDTEVANSLAYTLGPDNFVIAYATPALAIPLAALNPIMQVFDGPVTATLNVAPGAGETVSVTVDGINKATGLPLIEVVVIAELATQGVTVASFSDVTEFSIAESGGSASATAILAGPAFDLKVADFPFVKDAVNHINSFASRGYAATATDPAVARIPLNELDSLIVADINTPLKGSLRADLFFVIEQINERSTLVTASRPVGGNLPPVATAGTVFLAGGTEAAPDLAGYQTSLVALQGENVQFLWPDSSDAAIHAATVAHCQFMAGEGQGERACWLGAATGESLAALGVRTAALNTRHVGFVGQDVDVFDVDGSTRALTPVSYALMHAAAQASVPSGTPLTHKRLNIRAVRSSGWSPSADKKEAIDLGIVVTEADRLGFRIVRSVTTFREVKNHPFTETSSNQSFNDSLRDIRENLDLLVGLDDSLVTEAGLKILVKGRLRQQVRGTGGLGVALIKGFIDNSVTVNQDNDAFVVAYKMVPKNPVNFVLLAVTVVRSTELAAAA